MSISSHGDLPECPALSNSTFNKISETFLYIPHITEMWYTQEIHYTKVSTEISHHNIVDITIKCLLLRTRLADMM